MADISIGVDGVYGLLAIKPVHHHGSVGMQG